MLYTAAAASCPFLDTNFVLLYLSVFLFCRVETWLSVKGNVRTSYIVESEPSAAFMAIKFGFVDFGALIPAIVIGYGPQILRPHRESRPARGRLDNGRGCGNGPHLARF